jgi:dihydropteroate synthase
MPKGKQTAKTLEKRTTKEAYNQRVMKHVDEIFTAQLANAKGNTYIYEVVEIDIGGGKTKKKHELITNPHIIAQVLDENQGSSGAVDGGYFIVTTEKPDNFAIKDMLDRAFGTATQSVEMSGKDGGAIETKTELTQIVIQSK